MASARLAAHSRAPAEARGGSGAAHSAWGLPEDGTRVVMLSSLTHHAGMLNWEDPLVGCVCERVCVWLWQGAALLFSLTHHAGMLAGRGA